MVAEVLNAIPLLCVFQSSANKSLQSSPLLRIQPKGFVKGEVSDFSEMPPVVFSNTPPSSFTIGFTPWHMSKWCHIIHNTY